MIYMLANIFLLRLSPTLQDLLILLIPILFYYVIFKANQLHLNLLHTSHLIKTSVASEKRLKMKSQTTVRAEAGQVSGTELPD